MKKLYYLATALLVLACAAGCKKNSDVQEPESKGQMKPFTVEAGHGGQKTSMIGSKLTWTAGDKIIVVKKSSSLSSELTLSGGEGTESGTFSGEISADVKKGDALYGLYKATYNKGSDNFSASVPAEQTYNATSFQEGIYPSIGAGTFDEPVTSIPFYNPMGVLRLNLKGTATVTQVKITAASSNIAGDFTVSNSFAVTGGGNSKSITITCSPAITLDATGKYFNFVTAPFTSQTVTVEVTTSTTTVSSDITVAVTASSATKQDVEVVEVDYGKCKASDYTQVTIGTQVWMAENYACRKYDTNAVNNELTEAFKNTYKDEIGNIVVPTSSSSVYTPYYADATKATKPDYMTDAQMAKLGYLYNWAAAVGVADGREQTSAFSVSRQGICPNGWHVPTSTEWQTLYDYIYSDKSLTSNQVGKYLKTTSGWRNNGNGTDTYGFAALPAGYADGSSVSNVGSRAYFWTATPDESYSNLAYYRYLYYGYDYLGSDSDGKNSGRSVRCLMN